LDITSIVTLDYLGLLEKAMAHFEHVIIAPRTLSMLFLERQFIKFHQPSEMAKAQRLQALIAAGRLKVIASETAPASPRVKEIGSELVALLSTAGRDGGLVVRSAPVFKVGSFLEEQADMSGDNGVLTRHVERSCFFVSQRKNRFRDKGTSGILPAAGGCRLENLGPNQLPVEVIS
jgi:hypothetical protein